MAKPIPDTKQALEMVLEHCSLKGFANVSTEKASGRMLAQNIVADRDFPPFHRVTMDGIALKFSGIEKGNKKFQRQCIQMAGEKAHRLEREEYCIEIMTGAKLPDECDCIIPYEELEKSSENGIIYFEVKAQSYKKMQNIHLRGSDALKGTILLEAGKIINENDIAIAAGCGYSKLKVKRKPKFLVISTGNELVDIDETPADHQIRMSNGILLGALIERWGGKARVMKVKDDAEQVAQIMGEWENNVDAIILTGAVSKGKSDFVPALVAEKNYEIVFHGVAQRPGKPFLFASKKGKVIFGFPGNPAAVNACARLYLEPWIKKNISGNSPRLAQLKLGEDFSFNKALDYFLPVKKSGTWAFPQLSNGSGDFISIKDSDGYLILPKNREQFEKGSEWDFISFAL